MVLFYRLTAGINWVIVAFMRPQPRLSLVKGERQIRYDVTLCDTEKTDNASI